MRIHSDIITNRHLREAATLARVDFADCTKHGSRSRHHAFNLLLRGESNRAPNFGTARNVDRFDVSDRAATWDQWGVFLAALFEIDPNMVTPYYADSVDFANRTANRFGEPEVEYKHEFNAYGWPADAHGDHTFRYQGVPHEQSCTKCSAKQRWGR